MGYIFKRILIERFRFSFRVKIEYKVQEFERTYDFLLGKPRRSLGWLVIGGRCNLDPPSSGGVLGGRLPGVRRHAAEFHGAAGELVLLKAATWFHPRKESMTLCPHTQPMFQSATVRCATGSNWGLRIPVVA